MEHLMSILNDKIPFSVLKLIGEFYGDSELNKSIKNFNSKELINRFWTNWNKIKLSQIKLIELVKNKQNSNNSNNSNYSNFSTYHLILKGTRLFIETDRMQRQIFSPFSTKKIFGLFSDDYLDIKMTIGINKLENSNSNYTEFAKYSGIDKHKDFLTFMCKFEDKVYSEMVKNSKINKLLQTYKFVPIVIAKDIKQIIFPNDNESNPDLDPNPNPNPEHNPNLIYDNDFDCDNPNDWIDTNESKIIGYAYQLKMIFDKNSKYYRKNNQSEKFEEISKSDFFSSINNYSNKFILNPILFIDHQRQIILLKFKIKAIWTIML